MPKFRLSRSDRTRAPRKDFAALAVLALGWLAFASIPAAAGGRFQSTPERIQKISRLADAYSSRGMFQGSLLISLDGGIIFEKGYGPASLEWGITNSPDTVFNIASLSKAFTATAVLLLVEAGKIGLDAPVSRYLPWLRADLAEQITVRRLMTHTAGLPDEPVSPVERPDRPIRSKAELIAAINRIDLVFAPGERSSYSNVGYNILALIVEERGGMEFADFLEQRIFAPLGMERTRVKRPRAIIENRAQGYFSYLGRNEIEEHAGADYELQGPGNVFSTVRDLAKWDRALADHTLLSSKATEMMFTPDKGAYGFGWELPPNLYIDGVTVRLAQHSGAAPGASALTMRFLDDRLFVVALGNRQRSFLPQMIGSFINVLAGEKSTLEKEPLPPAEDEILETLLDRGVETGAAFYRERQQAGTHRMPGSGGLNRLAYQLLRSGRTDQAMRVFELFQTLFPTQSIAYDGYAEALALSGDKDAAITYYRKALELSFSNAAALRALKVFGVADPTRLSSPLYREIIDRGAEAGLEMYKGLEKEGRAPAERILNAVAYNCFRNGRKSEAIRLFAFNTLAFPSSSNAWESFGEAQFDAGNKELAIRMYRKSLELNPQNKNALDKLRDLGKNKEE